MSGSPSADNGFLAEHVAHLLDSYQRLLGRTLLENLDSPIATAEAIFNAKFAVLSSGTESDPMFNYANQTALTLFELDWDTLITLPARQSAEPSLQTTRAKLMAQVQQNGFIDGYSGIRVSASGRRFMIEQATVWNVIGVDGQAHGQAATFSNWRTV